MVEGCKDKKKWFSSCTETYGTFFAHFVCLVFGCRRIACDPLYAVLLHVPRCPAPLSA